MPDYELIARLYRVAMIDSDAVKQINSVFILTSLHKSNHLKFAHDICESFCYEFTASAKYVQVDGSQVVEKDFLFKYVKGLDKEITDAMGIYK